VNERPAGSPADTLRLLEGVQRLLRERLVAFFGDRGFTVGEGQVLQWVHGEAALTVSELSRRMGLSKGHVSGVVDRLVQHGLMRRDADPRDHRQVRLALTDEGAGFCVSLVEQYRRMMEELVGGLGQDTEALFDGLAEVRRGLAGTEN
jgi:DNA-binding MarR family transcriptional regulator